VATTPPGEQQLLERLRAAASEAGCRAPDVVTSVYIGLKIGMRICVCGAAPGAAQALVEAVVATLVGLDSEQVLRLHGPLAGRPSALPDRPEDVTRRYAAVRLNEFVAAAVDPLAQGKAWFVVAEAADQAGALARWLDHELRTALRSAGVRSAPNLFVLLAAHEGPSGRPGSAEGAAALPGRPVPPHVERGWLCVPLRRFKRPTTQRAAAVPPVGYQRQLLDSLLTGPLYRKLLRAQPPRLRYGARRGGLARRWLAASRDAAGRGLWRPSPAANARRALLALERTRRIPGPGDLSPGSGDKSPG